jgi:hypothetical protein
MPCEAVCETVLPLPAELTPLERARLQALEGRVEKGLRGCDDAVQALLEIYRGHLYRATHDDFGAYCLARWPQYGRRYIYRLLRLGEVQENLSATAQMGPMGHKRTEPNERQARELAALEPADQVKVWQKATETRKSSAADLKDAVEDLGDIRAKAAAQRGDGRRELLERMISYLRRLARLSQQLDAGEGDEIREAIDHARDLVEALKAALAA